MSILADKPLVLTAPPAPPRTAFTDVVNSLGEKLSAALAHTSPSAVLESRRQIELVLCRKLEPRFALELVTLLLEPGNEGRSCAPPLSNWSMTESPEWALSSTRVPSATADADIEARFLASEESAGAKHLARCGECLARTAPELEGRSLTKEQEGELTFALCGQCRSGTDAWYRR